MPPDKQKPPMETLTSAVGPQADGLSEQARSAAAQEAPDPATPRRGAKRTRGGDA